jgi:hypothetical protein
MVKPCLQETTPHLPQVMTSCACSLRNHQSNRSSSSKAPPVYISVVRNTNSSLRLARRSSACVSNLTFLPLAVRARQKAKNPYRFPMHGPHTLMPHPLHQDATSPGTRACTRPNALSSSSRPTISPSPSRRYGAGCPGSSWCFRCGGTTPWLCGSSPSINDRAEWASSSESRNVLLDRTCADRFRSCIKVDHRDRVDDIREDNDESWRRPTPHGERRRAGKHTRRVVVK